MRVVLPLMVILLFGCGPEGEQHASPVDYNAINRKALGPAQPITPEPIKTFELTGIGPSACVMAGEAEREVLFVATPSIGAMRLRGENVRFSPAPSEAELPYDIAAKFTGQSYEVELSIDLQTETPAGPALSYFMGGMTVRDRYDRVVFDYRGRVECAAEA